MYFKCAIILAGKALAVSLNTHYLLPPGFGIFPYPSLSTGFVTLPDLLVCGLSSEVDPESRSFGNSATGAL